jgi:hypothetical protein
MGRYRPTIELLEEALRQMDMTGEHLAAAHIAQAIDLLKEKANRG